MTKTQLPLAVLALAAFLAPLLGGQVPVEPQPSTSFLTGVLLGELPFSAHALLALLVLGSAVATLVSRRVVQIPGAWLTSLLALLMALIGLSMASSQFRFASQMAFLEWLAYAAAFFAAVAAAGRRRGPTLIVGCVAGGGVLLALRALSEFGETRSPMFAGWNNPNALAGMLLVSFFCCLGLAASLKERFLVPLLGAVAIGLALVLTQSKGGLLVLGGASVVFLAMTLAWGGEAKKAAFGRGIGAMAVVAILVVAMQASQSRQPGAQPGGAPLARVSSAGETQVQSFTFRKLLYQTSLDLVKQYPLGTGVGTFQHYSAKPGRVTSTVYAHNTALQLAAESSPLAALAFVGFAAAWLIQMFRGARKVAAEVNLLRAGIVAAVLAAGGQSVIESSFSYFGIGLAVFLLAGTGLLLASDAVAPEQAPPELRYATAALAAVIGACFLVNVYIEAGKGAMASALLRGDRAGVLAAAGPLEGLAGGDGQFWSLKAKAAESKQTLKADLIRASNVSPQPKFLRQLGRMYAEEGKNGEAAAAFDQALLWDPNNLPTLRALLELEQSQGRDDAVRATAERLIAVEQKTYYTVRSLAELIPTETFYARLALAKMEKPSGRGKLLNEALEGYQRYADITVRQVLLFASSGLNGYAGESVEDALARMEEARECAVLFAVADEKASRDYLARFAEVVAKLESARDGLQ